MTTRLEPSSIPQDLQIVPSFQLPSASRAATFAIGGVSLAALDGCAAIKGIFEAGFGIGVLVVVAVVATIGGIAAMLRRK